MSWIDDYLKAFANTVTASAEAGWFPFSWYRLCPYFADLDVARWREIAESAKKNKITIQDLARAFHGPLAPRFEIHYMMYECKTAQAAQAELEQVIDFLNEICKARCIDDFYGLASAKIYTPDQLETILNALPWQQIGEQDRRKIGNLIMAAIQLSYAYFSDYFYAQCFELSGPYPMRGGGKLIIRKFQNFHPQEIWPQGPFPKFQTLEIYSVYDTPEIVIDQWSHIQSKHNLAQSLKRVAVVVDGKPAPLSQILPLMENIAACAAEIQNQWKNFNFEKTKRLMLALRWYQFKAVMNLVGLPWEPAKAMRERIKSRQLLPEITPRLNTQKQAQTWWSNLIDPRINNLPKSYIKPWTKK